MGHLSRVATLTFLVATAVACATEPVLVLDEGTTAGGAPSSSAETGSGGDDDDGSSSSSNDGGSAPSGPTTTGGDGGSSGDGGSAPSGGTGGEEPTNGTFTADVGDADLELRDSATVTVTLVADGDVGQVELVVEGLPEDVGASFANDTVTLLDGTQTVELELSSASSTSVGAHPFTVRAIGPAGDQTADGQVVVAPVLTVFIPMNLVDLQENPPNTTAFGDYPTMIEAPPNLSGDNPVTIRFFNQDAVPHQIHAGDQNGFNHSQADIPANGFDPMDRQVTAPGTYDYYPHDCCGQSILGQIVIQ